MSVPTRGEAFSWNVSNYRQQPSRKNWCRFKSKWQAAETSVLMATDTHTVILVAPESTHTPHRAPPVPALINTADLLSWQLSAMFQADWLCNLSADGWLSCHICATNTTPSHQLTQHWHFSVWSLQSGVRRDVCWMLHKDKSGMGCLEWSCMKLRATETFDILKWKIPQSERGRELKAEQTLNPNSTIYPQKHTHGL